MFVTVTSARKDVGTLIEQECTLEELIETCTQYETGPKDGEALIPARFKQCPEGHCNGTGWDCGGGRDHRLSRNVYEMHALGIDIDDVSSATVDQITDSLEARGLTFIAWSTHSNAPPENCRIRLLFPFAEPMPLVNPRQWSAVAWPALVRHLGLPVGTDFSCRNGDRVFYLPRIASMDTPHAAGAHRGALLDWRPIVGEAIAAQAQELQAIVPAAEEDTGRDVDTAAVRALLEKISTSVYLKRALKGTAPTPPPDRRGPGDSSRREAWRDITVLIANAVEGWEASSVLLDEFIRPAWRAEVAESPEDHTPWEKIEELFASARASAPTYKADKRARERAWHELARGRLRRIAAAPVGGQIATVEPRALEAPAPVAAAEGAAVADEAPAPAKPQEPRAYRLDDVGNGERFLDQHKHHLRYVPSWGAWLAWDGKRWAKEDKTVTIEHAAVTARSIFAEAATKLEATAQQEVTKWAHLSGMKRALDAMVSVAGGYTGMRTAVDQLDADPLILNVSNGTIDLHTGTLRAHTPDDLITRLSPVEYDPHALCPTWERFLERVVPDEHMRIYVQTSVGYALTGDVSEQVLFFLHGGGSNGKSTFLTTLQYVFGDYAKQGASDLLLSSNYEVHPASQADLMGARFVVCSEVEHGKAFAEAQVKQLTGGDVIKARFMRQDFFEFRPTHKIFLAANHQPSVRGTDHAIWRRLRLIPFEAKIEGAEIDTRLKEKLRAEAAGILAWCVRGCLAWQAKGLGLPAIVQQASTVYRENQDTLVHFIGDAMDVVAGSFITSSEIYSVFVRWCERNGEKPWSGRALSSALIDHGYESKRTATARGFVGLAAKNMPRSVQVALSVVKAGT